MKSNEALSIEYRSGLYVEYNCGAHLQIASLALT